MLQRQDLMLLMFQRPRRLGLQGGCRAAGARARPRARRARLGKRRDASGAARSAQVLAQKRFEVSLVPVGHRRLDPRPHVPHVAHCLHRYVVPRSELGSCRVARHARLLPRENVNGSLRVERPWRLNCVMLVPGQCHAWVGSDGQRDYGGARLCLLTDAESCSANI